LFTWLQGTRRSAPPSNNIVGHGTVLIDASNRAIGEHALIFSLSELLHSTL
jgi:hypothetical protein